MNKQFYENLFTGPSEEQSVKMKKNQIVELLYMDFLDRYTKVFNSAPDLSIAGPVYEQLKELKF